MHITRVLQWNQMNWLNWLITCVRTEVVFSNRRKHASSLIGLKPDVYPPGLVQIWPSSTAHMCLYTNKKSLATLQETQQIMQRKMQAMCKESIDEFSAHGNSESRVPNRCIAHHCCFWIKHLRYLASTSIYLTNNRAGEPRLQWRQGWKCEVRKAPQAEAPQADLKEGCRVRVSFQSYAKRSHLLFSFSSYLLV